MEFTKDIYFNNPLKAGETCELTYSGALFTRPSDSVTIVYGFGENWDYTSEKQMEKNNLGFTVKIEMPDHFDTFNFCFRNSHYEWDNNCSFNYISAILPSSQTIEIEKTEISSVEQTNHCPTIELIEPCNDSLTQESINSVSKLQSEFQMEQLVEQLLMPIIYNSTSEENLKNTFDELKYTFEEIINEEHFNTLNASLLDDTNFNEFISETDTSINLKTTPINSQMSEVNSNSSTVLVSPRKLRKSYIMRKKIKVASYKALVVIPKLLTGTYDNSLN